VLATTFAQEQLDIPLTVALSKALKFSVNYDKLEGTSTIVKFATAADMATAVARANQRELGPFTLTPWQPTV
jgi:hypothetical protein